MMCRLNELLIVASCLWIPCDAQVEGFFSDGLNPEQVDLSVWHQRSPRVAVRTNDRLACEKPNIYFCEEPPNLIPPESSKTCNYRNIWYQEQVFRWVAGRGCLLYTPDFLFIGGRNPMNLNAGCVYGNLFAPCLEVVKDDGTCGCFPFDPSLEVVARAVRRALVPSIHGRWERCFYGASDCCSHFMNGNYNVTEINQCSPTFDGWTCWLPAQNGSVARSVCPEFAYSNSGPTCHHFSHKQCHSDGAWELQTDYSTCSITPRLLRRYRYFIAVLAFSVVTSFPAICIFISYKRLHVTRVALHRNLLIAIVLRNIIVIISRNVFHTMWIFYKRLYVTRVTYCNNLLSATYYILRNIIVNVGRSVIYIDELTNAGDTIMSQNGVACRTLAFLERLAANAVFVCMLMEGVYLHRLIVAVFKQKLSMKMFYSVGILFAILPVIAWSVVMSLHNDHSCWLVYTVDHVQWALDAPRLLILLVNAVLYIDVLRVLFTKMRNNENSNQLNTAKATLFLMPIFGVQFLFTVFRPYTSHCEVEQFYYIVAYTIEGLQGFVVALLYCYINKEVHALIKNTYKKVKDTVTSRIKGSSYYPRISGDPKTDRRFTYTSGLTTNMAKADDMKYQYSTMEPKLHVAEIISIQASERLAEILDPVYETIDNGLNTESYDYLERSNAEYDSEFTPNKNFNKVDEYYGFTNASSVSIGCPEWLRRVSSSSSSIYSPSITASHAIKEEIPEDTNTNSLEAKTASHRNDLDNKETPASSEYENTLDDLCEFTSNNNINDGKDLDTYDDLELGCGNCNNMLDEIMQCMEIKDDNDIKLNPELLAPNRSERDKVIFVE